MSNNKRSEFTRRYKHLTMKNNTTKKEKLGQRS